MPTNLLPVALVSAYLTSLAFQSFAGVSLTFLGFAIYHFFVIDKLASHVSSLISRLDQHTAEIDTALLDHDS